MRDWEKHYRERDMPWDHGEPAPPLREVLDDWPGEIWGGGSVLVPGCGRGHDVAQLGRAGHRAIGLDLAPTAIALATKLYGDDEGLTFAVGDFIQADASPDPEVTAVWEHTLFCALPVEQRKSYVAAAARWLGAGQRLIGVFYLDPGPGEGPPFAVEREELVNLFAGSFEIVREAVPRRFYPSREGRELLVELIRTP